MILQFIVVFSQTVDVLLHRFHTFSVSLKLYLQTVDSFRLLTTSRFFCFNDLIQFCNFLHKLVSFSLETVYLDGLFLHLLLQRRRIYCFLGLYALI